MSVWTRNARFAYRSYLLVVCLQSIPLSLVTALQGSYLTMYATDVLLIAPAAVGTLFAVARLYDGVTDVLVGWWSDRRTGPGGRRRPFLLAGALSMIPFAFLWLPPEGLEGLQLVIFFGVALLLFESLSTLVLVPFHALGIESARTPRQRSFAVSLSRAIGVLGLIAGFAIMQALINSEDARSDAGPYIIAVSVLSMLAIGSGALQVRELRLEQPRRPGSPWRQLRETFSLGYFRQFMVIHGASWFCFASLSFGTAYVMRYIVDAPELTMAVFLCYFLMQSLTPLLWFRLIPRLGLIRLWLIGKGLWVLTLVSFPAVFWFGAPAFLAMALLAGIATGAGTCCAPAVLGDIVDLDARRSGSQRQGVYMTLYILSGKVVAAGAVFFLGWFLQVAGFVPNVAQETPAIAAISLSVSVLPLLGILLSIRLLRRFSFYRDTGRSDGRDAPETLGAPQMETTPLS